YKSRCYKTGLFGASSGGSPTGGARPVNFFAQYPSAAACATRREMVFSGDGDDGIFDEAYLPPATLWPSISGAAIIVTGKP
ncbi:MAG: hypothetical protein M3294_07095, partial [Pseudomonadota bacterium]|nr:hypothetical protein [Pseudomonadota bacterium]